MSEWQNDIERYRNGELTSDEMHSLEKRALTDPFLADALEGADTISASQFSSDVGELRKSIERHTEAEVVSFEQAKRVSVSASSQMLNSPLGTGKTSRSKWMWPLRIAASILVMLGVFWAVNELIPKQQKENLSLNQQNEVKKDAQASKPNKLNEADVTSQPSASSPAKLPEKSQPIVSAKSAEPASLGASDATTKEAEETVAEVVEQKRTSTEEPSKETMTIDPAQTEKVVTAEPSADRMKSRSELASSAPPSKKSVAARRVMGQVLSAEDGQPLPGVNVVLQGTTVGAVTDVDGKYQFVVEAPNPKLVFSFIGFQAQQIAVEDQQQVNVKLSPDLTQLSEVVVSGTAARDDDQRPAIVKLAEPAGGRKAYDKYLDNSLRYPTEALAKKIKGRVTVKFTVRTNGALDEFSVVKSLGYGCDEEVLRLVKEGPSWSPTLEDDVPVESEVLVKVRFDPSKARQ